MYLSTRSLKQVAAFLACLLSLSIFKVVSASDSDSSGNPFGTCFDSDENAIDDGPTDDKSPGIGVEFETDKITFHNSQCPLLDTIKSKGHLIGNRKGDNWQLTAETTLEQAGILQAEYILDGTQIKIGTSSAGPAAAKLANDLMTWNPSTGDEVNIDGNICNPWSIIVAAAPANIRWSRQITAPLPLAAINVLIQESKAGQQATTLLPDSGSNPLASNFVWVQPEFFQASPYGMTKNNVKEDALGVFSLVLSYGKSAEILPPGQSPKRLTTIMPRTDFATMFSLIRSGIEDALAAGSLYDIVNILACYKNAAGGSVEIDTNFCDGTLEAPKPNGRMDSTKFALTYGKIRYEVEIKDWMDGLKSGHDYLTKADANIMDSQVGGLGSATEYVLGTNHPAPIFEFRDLGSSTASTFEADVNKAEQEIIAFHRLFANDAKRLKKRQSTSSVVCLLATTAGLGTATEIPVTATTSLGAATTGLGDATISLGTRTTGPETAITSLGTATTGPALATITPEACVLYEEDPDQGINQAYCVCGGSTTLPPLSVPLTGEQSDSCAYTIMPTTSSAPAAITTMLTSIAPATITTVSTTSATSLATISISTEESVYTRNCQVCTQIQLNAPTCTSVPGCFLASAVVTVTASSAPVHVGTLTGTALYTSISSALEMLCPPVTQTTTSTQCAKTAAVIKEIASYNITSLRDAMIHAAALTAQEASTGKGNCYNTTYEVENLKRDLPLLSFGPRYGLAERDHPHPEQNSIEFCNSLPLAAVDYYSPWWREAAQPGASSYIWLGLTFHLGPGGSFLCDFIQDLVEAFAPIAPEFAVADVEVGETIVALCQKVEDGDIAGIIGGVTG